MENIEQNNWFHPFNSEEELDKFLIGEDEDYYQYVEFEEMPNE